ncbi:glycosyltransferase [Gillisia sp. M10.2A]|uniref:Glycosyltransferase n=1 Tax=Gillisia lutea TaxID=2909668 RepID=A0ABS9EBH1_9FLAO|nr:glycosyltransferase [Gillisia lutea]MCF4100223.1 glycosyltransferase [Gillisia lutea]
MIVLLVLISTLYAFLLVSLFLGWRKIPLTRLQHLAPTANFSIVIPFRNEAENLPQLLESISILEYSSKKFEILLIDDASEDDSYNICSTFIKTHHDFNIQVLKNIRSSNSPKKDAITIAIESAKFEYIITTDADCQVPKKWLQAFNEGLQSKSADMLAGPVAYISDNSSWLTIFQDLDLVSLQIAGAGSFGLKKAFLCNGANLCYRKTAFEEVDGFSGNEQISSGDDVFLLQKFVAENKKVSFLKNEKAIVLTSPQPTLKELLSQRIRWAAKTHAYKSVFSKLIGISVLLMNLSIVVAFLLTLTGTFPITWLAFLFLLKFNIDFILLQQAAYFFGKKGILSSYFWSSILYPFFSTYVAIASLFKGFEWKGRNFNR